MRWARRGGLLTALVSGWVFIAWQNHFHISAPVAFVCLGYLAVVATIYNLWRTGASAVASEDGEDDSTWAKPSGALGELERERRTLLKAIKEAEFDQQMGKLSPRDALDMIETYKARIYEVYAEIDKLELGAAGSKREAILREVKARLEVDAKAGAKKAGKAEAKPAGKKAKKADAKSEKSGATADAEAKPDADAKAEAEANADDNADDNAEAAAVLAEASDDHDAGAKSGKPSVASVIDDDVLEADSTTAIEPPKDAGKRAAKEATP